MSSKPGDERLPGLWKRWKNNNDLIARDELLERYMPMVKDNVSRIAPDWLSREDREDMAGWVRLRLLRLVLDFDPGLGFKFETYANPGLRGEALSYLRNNDWEPRALKARRKAGEDLPRHRVVSLSEAVELAELVIDPAPGPEAQALTRLEYEALAEHVEALALVDRLVLEGVFRDELTHDEIAGQVGLTKAVVYHTKKRALQRVREKLENPDE